MTPEADRMLNPERPAESLVQKAARLEAAQRSKRPQAAELGRAAFQLRNPFHLPGLRVGIDPDLAAPLADLLDYIDREHPQVDMTANPSCDPGCDGHDAWSYCRRCGGFVICETRENALAVARIINQPADDGRRRDR